MNKIQKSFIVLLIIIVLGVSYSIVFDSLIGNFTNAAKSKEDLIAKHVQLSNNIIEGLDAYGDLFFEQGNTKEPELYRYLKYNPSVNGYDLDNISDVNLKWQAGNLTGQGSIPTSGAARDELNLALEYNKFFRVYYSDFPDIAWLYFTGESDLIFMYPWVSSKEFRYSEHLKQVEFYKGAEPENNPERKFVWSPVYLDAAGKGLMVTLSAPVYDNDSFRGVVSLDLTNAWLSKEIQSNYESYLIDDAFNVLAASRKQLSSGTIDKLSKHLKLSPDQLEELLKLEENTVQRIGQYYIYPAGFKDVSWKLIFVVPVWIIIGKTIFYIFPILLVCILFLLTVSQMEKRKKSESLLAKKNDLLETTMYSIDEGIIVTDQYGNITLMNKTAEEYTGWSNEEACGQKFQTIFNNVDALTRKPGYDPVTKVLDTGQNIFAGSKAVLISRSGVEIYISGAVSAIRSENNDITGAVVSFRDITKEYEQEKQIEGFLELNFDMLCVVDSKGNYHRVNRKFEEVLGYKSEELAGKSFLTHIHEDDIETTIKAVQKLVQNKPLSSLVNRFQCKDGTYKYIEWHAQSRVGKFVYSSARDVTAQVIREEKLETIAGKDQLTGVYNRYYFDSIIDGEMERSDYFGQPLSMALIDMDHFKNVNDTWGHPVGDEVLKHTADIIKGAIRDSDILVRFGGEEFILMMPTTSLTGAIEAAEKVRSAIEKNTHRIAGRQTASFGVAERSKAEAFISWYNRADEALYQAKDKGRNCVVAAKESVESQL